MMNKEHWQYVKDQLSVPYGRVELKIDGYAVTLAVRAIKPLKYVIMVYVDGVCRGEWSKGEADESKRFCRPVVHALYSPAKKKAALSGLKKKSDIQYITDALSLNKTFTFWDVTWPTFAPLKRHLLANNKSIELVISAEERGALAAAVEAA